MDIARFEARYICFTLTFGYSSMHISLGISLSPHSARGTPVLEYRLQCNIEFNSPVPNPLFTTVLGNCHTFNNAAPG